MKFKIYFFSFLLLLQFKDKKDILVSSLFELRQQQILNKEKSNLVFGF